MSKLFQKKLFLIVIAFALIPALFNSNANVYSEENQPAIDNGVPWNPAQSDQWVATDNLSRSLPTFDEVGATRPDKYIACFYFLWLGRHGEAGPYNISKILEEHPEAKDDPNSKCWGALGAPHHWGESIFGYYVGEDESVLRKHAQMLGDAGVDVICFDVTNQLTYPESYRPLFKVFSEMQKEGNKVPKVAFLCPFWTPDKVVRELWRDVYSQNFYPDVWFTWKGKPLILADPDLLSHNVFSTTNCDPYELKNDGVLAQKFASDVEIDRITLDSPTWKETNSAVSVAILDESGKTIDKRKSIKVGDNAPYSIEFKKPLPAGTYTVELRKAPGAKVGWWGHKLTEGNYEEVANKAYPQKSVRWLAATANGTPVNTVFLISFGEYDKERADILNFFTFRPSQPDYFMGPTKKNQWSWLEAYPQHEFYNDKGEVEEMGVGVAQNAVDGKLGVLSNPRSYGRSYHNGAEPAPEDCDYTGKNFQEQWERALKVDPEIIFVTGWNEWIAGRFDITAPFNGATPVSFVDQYNTEFSRDCEPMKGKHEDAYYYQLISNIRRFKGVSQPELGKPQPIHIDGKFDDWKKVGPKFFDTVSDPVHRDCRGWGKGMRYVNQTGRNDFVESRVSYDASNLYFYVKMKDTVEGDFSSSNWISLLLDVDENAQTGDKGNDYLVAADAESKGFAITGMKEGSLDKTSSSPIKYAISGNELELAIPRKALGLTASLPNFRFKWTDGIDVFGDWSGFTTDGDAAPNDRYYYRYLTSNK
ncbi:MAG: hypothetical protein II486_12815 [Thermoguttaceae bacterium]|nr:hypothetical protein [Thermoguttaceae bacterium]